MNDKYLLEHFLFARLLISLSLFLSLSFSDTHLHKRVSMLSHIWGDVAWCSFCRSALSTSSGGHSRVVFKIKTFRSSELLVSPSLSLLLIFDFPTEKKIQVTIVFSMLFVSIPSSPCCSSVDAHREEILQKRWGARETNFRFSYLVTHYNQLFNNRRFISDERKLSSEQRSQSSLLN